MIRLMIAAVVRLLANAIGLLVAAAVLDDVSVSGAAFILAVVIFTVVEALLDPLFTNMAERNAPALRGGTALVTTFLGLVVTSLVTDGLHIKGVSTWLLATLIVWLASLIGGLLVPLFLVKRARDDRRGR
jgi:uncharacterized membrane protein YvlD (DUF360 family)